MILDAGLPTFKLFILFSPQLPQDLRSMLLGNKAFMFLHTYDEVMAPGCSCSATGLVHHNSPPLASVVVSNTVIALTAL